MIDYNIKDRVATIFMYGDIGPDYFDDGQSIPDIDFASVMKWCESQADEIHVRINSWGGSMKHVWGMINTIQNNKSDVHTYNDGVCSSSGFLLFISVPVENRHYGNLAGWLAHPVISFVEGNQFQIRDHLELTEKLNKTCDDYVQANVTSPVDWMQINKDTWLTVDEAIKYGVVNKQEPYEIEKIEDTILNDKKIGDNQMGKYVQNSYKKFLNNHKNQKLAMENEQIQNQPAPVAPAPVATIIDAAPVPVAPVTEPVNAAVITQPAPQTLDFNAFAAETRASIERLEASNAAKDQTIANLSAIVNKMPGVDPANVALPNPINDHASAAYVDPFTAAAEANHVSIVNG